MSVTYIYSKQTLDLLGGEVQRRLVVRPSSVDYHTMDGAALFYDLVHRGRDTRFLCYIC